MKRLSIFFLSAALALASAASCSNGTGSSQQASASDVEYKDGRPLIKAALPEYWANPTGRYAVAVDDAVLPDHTVFYPKDLSRFPKKDKLPVLVMSGPGCDRTSSAFRPFFTEVASHGYMMIVSGPLTEETVNTGILPKNTKQDLLDAIDWAFVENAREGSPFYGKVDTDHVCAMGQSCGGIQALDIMGDPRVKLLTLFNSGLFAAPADGRFSMGAVMGRPKEETFSQIRVPIAYFVGGTDMARPNATDDFKYIENVPVLVAVREIPGDAHAGTFRENNGGAFAKACVAWLDWNFKGSRKASRMFVGAKNGIDSDPGWIECMHKNL